MSITLITGVPGSGKTLKAVWDHLRPYVGHVDVNVNDKGEEVRVPSKVYTNINSLQIEHELIEGGGTWTLIDAKKNEWSYSGNPMGLRNWHNWAKPGAKIFFDEFQKFWPPRPNGAAVPPDMQALDTHRHMGVDFVVITQNCNNVDRHLLGLVDRHIHVRRVANMPLAVCYEWDHASRSLNYKNSMSKSPWRYPVKAYKLYKSAELHTKQRRKVPAVLWFILAGLGGAAYAFPTLQARLTERITGKPAEVAPVSEAPSTSEPQTYVKDGVRYTVQTTQTAVEPLQPASAPSPLPLPAAVPVVAGCVVSVASDCKCYDTQGVKVPTVPDLCPNPSIKKPVEALAGIAEPVHRATHTPSDIQTIAALFGVNNSPNSRP